MICKPGMNPSNYLWPVNGVWVAVNQWGKMSGKQAKQLAYELLSAGADKVDWLVKKGVKEKQMLLNPVDILRFMK
jgi:GTP cyclohydrolase II